MFSAVDLSLGRVTALVNNGGVNGNKGRVDQLTAVDIRRVFQTNVDGTVHFTSTKRALSLFTLLLHFDDLCRLAT
jgi:NAD(P)-dependent dehydrogenase (short-subunit alcohol dehydrogenase family)